MAEMVHLFDHILIHVPDLPHKYGGTGPNPPPSLMILPPHTLAPPLAPAPLAPPCPAAPASTVWVPPSATTKPKASYASVASTPPAPPATSLLPKLVHLRKACTKQGTKLNVAILCPCAEALAAAPSLSDFITSDPLGACTPTTWSLTLWGDWLLRYADPLTSKDHAQLRAALDSFHAPGSAVVNRATTASLKFSHVLTVWPDGSSVSKADLLQVLHSHPQWHSATIVTPPQFIRPAWPVGPRFCRGLGFLDLLHCPLPP
ncbi:hypothetical protein AX15_006713 [Amanita polypyramis BW_CC]|nr:hypothetical protein AX15_006713 [Amanita polypyramis BW_CC]